MNLLSREPLVERAQVRPNGWGSIQRQQSTLPKEKEAGAVMFYVALGVLAVALVYRVASSGE